MEGLHLLGVVDGISSQLITFRIRHVDTEKLKKSLGGGFTGAATGVALSFVNSKPKAALDMIVPVVRNVLQSDYGIETDITVTNTAPLRGRAFSEFWPGIGMGFAVGLGSLAIWKLVARLIG